MIARNHEVTITGQQDWADFGVEEEVKAALDGVGVLYTPSGYAESEIKPERLAPLLEDWQTPAAAIFLYYPCRRQVPAPLQALIEFLRENPRRAESARPDAVRNSGPPLRYCSTSRMSTPGTEQQSRPELIGV